MTLTDLHLTYQYHHDALHGAYRSDCGERCPLVDHLVLQGACAAVKIKETAIRRNWRPRR